MGFDSSKSATVCNIHLPEGVLAGEPCAPVTYEVKQPRSDEGLPVRNREPVVKADGAELVPVA
jgi:hypothetical protein